MAPQTLALSSQPSLTPTLLLTTTPIPTLVPSPTEVFTASPSPTSRPPATPFRPNTSIPTDTPLQTATRVPAQTPTSDRVLVPLRPLQGDRVDALHGQSVKFDWTPTTAPYKLTLTRLPESNPTEEINDLMADSAEIEIAPPWEFGEDVSEYLWQVTDSAGRSLGSVKFSYSIPEFSIAIVPNSIILDPTEGTPGTEATVTGSGWKAGHEVNVQWDDGTELAATTVDGNGDFTVFFVVPDAAEGEHTIDFVGVPPDGEAYSIPATFTVVPTETQPPTLSWVKPVSNHGFYTTTSGTVELEVTATDNVSVRSVAFVRWDRVNLQWIGIDTGSSGDRLPSPSSRSNTDLSPPYQASVDVNTLNIGWNDIFAVVEDTAGNQVPVPIVISRLDPLVRALQFYESGYDGLPPDQRVYDQRFASETTRYINWELDIEYPAPGRRVDFKLTAIYFRDNRAGSWEEMHRHTVDAYAEGDWTESSYWWGYGFDDPGNWAIGFYLVDIYFEGSGIDGQLIASNRFEIY
jgi:hypothetical protein